MTRMFCSVCGITGFAETRWPGSDAAESLGWWLGGLPGFLICAWRHVLRTKHCALCGSAALARETRASAARQPCAPPHLERATGDDRMWPSHWRDPRARLRRGAGCVAAWGLLVIGLPAVAACAAVAWIATEALLGVRHRGVRARCAAWAADGRRLHIEIA